LDVSISSRHKGSTPTQKASTYTAVQAALLAAVLASSAAAQTPAPWTATTPDGKPDLQGVWTNATLTPLERPARFADRAFMTEAEAGELESQAERSFEQQAADRAQAAAAPRAGAAVGSYNQAVWADAKRKVVATRQTSLVVDPPDGRVPVRPEAERQRDTIVARETESYEFMNVWDRCITRGVPGGFFPAGYNNAYQILQTPGYVVIVSEMIHEARIIPTDGRPHRPAHLRSISGESVGRWDGDTLVVDTINYNDKGSIATASTAGRIRGVPQSEALHVVERFRRVDAGTISYTVTVEDPNVYTRPWTLSMPLVKDDDYRIYEYACHEANYAVANILRGARREDAEKPR
jgi:hypothetical protein